jgi:signal peptidase I
MDFSALMLLLLVVSGAIWAFDHWRGAPQRRKRVEDAQRAGDAALAGKALREPVMVEYARAFFPVILVVFVLRAFIVEPFRIPSGSMLPGLLPGDFILVSKSSYGVRLPVVNVRAVGSAMPARGDVVVFRYPAEPSVNYIKRMVGLPGDKVVYRDKKIYVNGVMMEQEPAAPYMLREPGQGLTQMYRWQETLGEIKHDILTMTAGNGPMLEFQVPEGHYFVLGDNRDRSNDSRYWGFVPDDHLVGRAFMIWFSWDMMAPRGWFWEKILWKRIGKTIE